MNKTLNILVTGCGGDIGQSVGKILIKSNFIGKLYGIDISNRNAGQFVYSNFSIGLPVTHPNYLYSLELFISKHDIDLIIPVSEPELRFFSEQNILVRVGSAKMIIASGLSLRIGFDKFATAEFLKNKNLPFPKTLLANRSMKIDKWPVILKSRVGSGSKEIHRINSMEEFIFYTKNGSSNYVVQELIDDKNGEYTCGLYRSGKGEVRTIILQRELTGGYSGYGEVIENNAITALLDTLADELQLIGSINVQLRISGNLPKIFEINPRFSSTVLFRHLFGFKDLEWSVKDLFGEKLEPYIQPSVGSKFYKGFSEYIKC
tara:strand:+ start:14986 stop:15939 length:954 start_codon:yes stop_codon:yes gene_type:complete